MLRELYGGGMALLLDNFFEVIVDKFVSASEACFFKFFFPGIMVRDAGA